MDLRWHSYKYYPYERELAVREVRSLLAPTMISEAWHGVRIDGATHESKAERLVYFAELRRGGHTTATQQARLERVNGNGPNRQSTRYSVHGLHEYKGRFNPQIARAILNILKIPARAQVLDPFCGSGTSLVECAHLGIDALGVDINPLAVLIANAKLQALRTRPELIVQTAQRAVRRAAAAKRSRADLGDRVTYLATWFDEAVLYEIERLRSALSGSADDSGPILFAIASNLLRDYSQQDPHDLRIRRRRTPLPQTGFREAFLSDANAFAERLAEAQSVLGTLRVDVQARLMDSRRLTFPHTNGCRRKFDCVLTSPPYATALPYIDTQRLSLVWLGLLSPSEVMRLDAELIGSREVRGVSKKNLLLALLGNRADLPARQADFCRGLQSALSKDDGFRRKATPMLLYRYFARMADTFRSVRACVKKRAPFALVVGANHTVLGGRRFDIDTPAHLSEIAQMCGWMHDETLRLQTYQRYGYHMSNAVTSEALVILRAA